MGHLPVRGDADLLIGQLVSVLHPPVDVPQDLGVPGGAQDRPVTLPDDVLFGDGQHPPGGGIHRHDGALAVQGDDPRRDVVQDGLDVALAAFEFGRFLGDAYLARLEVKDHLVEGVDQRPDLVRRGVLDLDVEVPPGDLPGGLDQFFDGHVDALSQMKADPARGKDDEERQEDEGHEVEGLHGVLLGLEQAVPLDVRGDVVHLLGVVLGQELSRGHEHASDRGHAERRPPPDHLPAPHGLDAPERFAELGPLDEVGLQVPVVLEGHVWIDVGEELFVIEEDADLVEPILGQLVADEVPQGGTVLGIDELPGHDGPAQLLSIVVGELFGVEGETVGDALRVVQELVQRRLEPLLDVPADEVAGEKEEEERRDER